MVIDDLPMHSSLFPFERFIHLPDRKFIDWCIEEYSVNQGIFNVIDQWFFDYGLENIIVRRKAIISFLLHANLHVSKGKTYIQFGKGGVKKSLHYFVNEC
ncbi:hypothetical protein JOC34_001587 [Virgibacillus halotolerans]|uniref:hypothetical protein n=1 Tax=Virgibacillus halotolerans TaxID=1071053 RepID=UPI0019614FB4|nr:hypothetical protein [Virgibacillus halotolerans]MBM7599219.1 hypothetical protein [Virgibacillus halotolerans]